MKIDRKETCRGPRRQAALECTASLGHDEARLRGQPAVAQHDTAAMRTMEMHQRQAAAQREAEFMTDELRIVPQGHGRVAEAVYPTSKSQAASVAAALRVCSRSFQQIIGRKRTLSNKLMSSMRAVQIPLPQRALKREKVRGSPVHRGGDEGAKSRRRVSRSKSVAMLSSSRGRSRLGRRSTLGPSTKHCQDRLGKVAFSELCIYI